MKKVIPVNSTLIPDGAERVFNGIIFSVYQWPQLQFDGSTATYEMVKRVDTINVIAIVDGKIVLLREEQPHHGQRVNFPLGKVDESDQTTLRAAQREVEEEIGYQFANWRLLDVKQFHPKIEWFIYTYVAWDKTAQVPPKLDPGEKISIELISFEELKKMADGNDYNDYIGRVSTALDDVVSIDELLELPEFVGKEVDR